jgi:hypothetical protein
MEGATAYRFLAGAKDRIAYGIPEINRFPRISTENG